MVMLPTSAALPSSCWSSQYFCRNSVTFAKTCVAFMNLGYTYGHDENAAVRVKKGGERGEERMREGRGEERDRETDRRRLLKERDCNLASPAWPASTES